MSEHEKQAKALFNRTWELLDTEPRELVDELEMLASAHMSRFHWQHAGDEVHWARGEWQLSRVYAVIGVAEAARFHGERCLKFARDNDPFDLGYAHEALARAAALTGNRSETRAHIKLAFVAAENVEDEDSKKMLLADLDSIRMKQD